jgi:signal transduction histidine kinase/ligand-binding sensor domain-containing protein
MTRVRARSVDDRLARSVRCPIVPPSATARARRARPWLQPALAAVLLVAAEAPVRALEPGLRFDQYAHTAWPSVAHASEVHALFIARPGYLWMGTSEGLVRFDGQRMLTFDPSNYPGATPGTANRVMESSDGSVWVGSFLHGLARLKDSRVMALGERDGVPAGRIQALLEDRQHDVWVGTSSGLARFSPGAARAAPAGEGLSSTCVHVLLQGRDGTLWAGLHEGLARWDGRRWRSEGGLPPRTMIDALWQDADGTLWAGTHADGLWHRRGDVWQVAGLGSPQVRALLRDQRGRLWVATSGGLFWQDAGGQFRDFVMPPALCATHVKALAEDAEGGLWLGTEHCGLHRLQDRRFRTFSTEDGVPAHDILGLVGAGDGSVWAGTRGGGIIRWRGDRVTAEPLSCTADLPCGECWDFSPGRGAEVLIVCGPNVVMRWDGSRLARVAPLPGGLPAASFAINASDGGVWMALEKQVVHQDRDTATVIAGQEVLEGTRILAEGRAGTIWIVAEDGVAVWRKGDLQILRLPAAEHPAEAANVLEDAEGTLWIATKGEGIRRLRDGRITTVGVAGGLPTGWIVQLLEDGRGRMWASSSKGIFWVDKSELGAVADGRLARLQANLYDAGDGVQMRGQSFGHPAGFKDGKGRLWFATSGGVAVVDPASLGAPPPRVVIEDLRLGGQRLDQGRGAGPAPRDLDVTFAALSFAPPDTIALRYRLRGRDPDTSWIDAGPSRTAHYAQLEHGDYQLMVEARHRDGDWSAEPALAAFVLRPPFHRSPLFVLLCALGAGLLLLLAHQLRIAQTRSGMQAVMIERSRIARDIHDTLAQAFAATSVQLECLEEALEGGDRTNVNRHLDTARKVVEESLDEARRAVWVLRPQAIDQGLAVALETLVKRVSGGTPVALEVMGTERTLPPMIASNLLRIAHEAVANARRHAHAGRIELRLGFTPGSVTLCVADDGKGFEEPLAASSGGTGVIGMKERAADMGAALSIDSGPDRGTTVRVEVPA